MRNYFFTNFKRPFPIQSGSISFFVSPLRNTTKLTLHLGDRPLSEDAVLHLRAGKIILRRPHVFLRCCRARNAAEPPLRLFKELLDKGTRPLPRIGHEYKLVFRAGRGDVEQPPLLFESLALLIIKPAAARHGRQYTVERVDYNDAVIFESLAAVYRAEDELAVRRPVFRGNALQLPQPLQEALPILLACGEDGEQLLHHQLHTAEIRRVLTRLLQRARKVVIEREKFQNDLPCRFLLRTFERLRRPAAVVAVFCRQLLIVRGLGLRRGALVLKQFHVLT